MIVKLLTEHHLEYLSSKEGYRGSSESTLVKWQSVGNHMSRDKYFCCAKVMTGTITHLCWCYMTNIF